jgi:hypothetical protein
MVTLVPIVMLAGCYSGTEPGVDAVGNPSAPARDPCGIRDSTHTNGDREVAEVREVICETNSGFLAPSVASIFVFVRARSAPRDPSNIAMRYEVVCPDTGSSCDTPPKVRWLNRSSLLITLTTFGDVYCVQRTSVDNISIRYSKTPLREPPQDAFTTVEDLCQ